jgi:hypothetical protein
LFLSSESVVANGFRFDVVGVTFFASGEPPCCEHVENAFEVT